MIVPIGHQEREVRRLPWVTFTLIAANALVFLFTDASAFARWGIVPDALRAHAFVTHMFVHSGWLHLIGNMLMLLLAGPPIEDRWGRALFAAFYGVSGASAAAFYAALTSDPSVPMVGASGAIAGVLGAFAVRLWSAKIRFAYFFVLGFRPTWGTFEAPAWAMLSLWFANELFQAWVWGSVGVGGGVAYWAHVGGFAFGAGAAWALGASGLEQRWIDPAIEARITRFSANPALENALAARERGDAADALAMLRAEWKRDPSDEIGLALWDAALACGESASAAPVLLAAVRSAAQRGEHELALRHWCELAGHAPDLLADPGTLLRFVPVLLAENQREHAATALRQAVDPRNAGLTPGQALRAFELARDLDPAVAALAAQRALLSPDLHEAKRAKLQGWLDEHGTPAEAAAPARRSVADGVVELARFARAKLTEARPISLDADGIQLALDGDRAARVGWLRIQAVSVAIIADLAQKPVLVIDLLANWNAAEAEELVGVRLRSDRYDPRPLLGSDGDPRRAFAALAGRMIQASRGQPLPSAEQALGNPFARFATLAEYERSVLDIIEQS
jgi:membrane associated rhomboid family serine protease